jgi:hypothetical protein
MSDVNTFIDAIGKDVNATVTPKVEHLAQGIGAKAVADYVPKISAFAKAREGHRRPECRL